MTSTELKHQARLQEWAGAIQDCRSSGLSVRQWCRQRGTTPTTYYRWERELLSIAGSTATLPETPAVAFADGLDLPVYSRGLGALGLPGDLSSQSRFVRAAFVRMNAKSGSSEAESVGQFFHILHAVEQQRGCCELDGGKYEITLYTSCCNADKGIYYYTTYGNHQITAVDMHRENLDGDRLVRYPLVQGEQIALQN